MIKDMSKKDLYYAYIIDAYEEPFTNIDEIQNPLFKEAVLYFKEKQNSNMGIGLMMSAYIFTSSEQNLNEEYQKIQQLLNNYINIYAEKNNKTTDDYTLKFINYGRTELVYVLTDDKTNEKITILVKQPVAEFGTVKNELDNLSKLSKLDKNVVAPIDYYSEGNQELYVTPYINQARCVASDNSWGMYVPEPNYRFVEFTPEQEKIVNTCMIAKLISYYDTETQEGLCACKLGGGDFMLKKGWENLKPSIKNTLENLYFISAREKIKCSLEEYSQIILD